MKAAVVEQYFKPLRVEDVPVPVPEPNELLVRVVVAGVNPFDWKQREGRDHRKTPFVAGQDFAGVVSGAGAAAREYRSGDRIVGIAREHGAYAEYTVIPQDDDQKQPVAKIPDGVSDAVAAALPTAGVTAFASVETLGVREATTLLICGVTGGVGGFAAQLARDRGAKVIGSGRASGEGDARAAGVDDFIAYDREDVAAAVKRRYPEGVDAVLDLVDDDEAIKATAPLLRKGGAIVSTIGALGAQLCRDLGVRGVNLEMSDTPQSSPAGLRALLDMVERGRLRVTIAGECPLAEAERALEESKRGGVRGKLVLTIRSAALPR